MAAMCCPCSDSGGCTDDNHSCEYWASIGECSENPDYMTVNCKRSCKICGGGGGGVAVGIKDSVHVDSCSLKLYSVQV